MYNEDNSLSKTEKISMIFLIISSLISSARGIYWIVNYNRAVHESPFYEALDRVAPLFVWGAPFLIGGILLILAGFNIVSQKVKRVFDVLLIAGGLVSGFSFLLIASASWSSALNWLTPVQNVCFSVGFFSLSWIGIDSLWKNKKTKKN